MTDPLLSLASLPSALSQLAQLESLVLTGQHNIASDGVDASILDGVTLPMLTELEFGRGSPATRALDLSGCRLRTSFPTYALRFLTALESLELGGCANISCFPPRSELSRLRNLRHLGLNGTSVTYLPPSVLFAYYPLLNVDLYDTPLSHTLDWSDHGLGSEMYGQKRGHFDWDRMAATLPLLTSLNISGNELEHPTSFDLKALRNLESFDVSRNPKLMSAVGSGDGEFSWWKVLSEHPGLKERVSFIGLADVGLGPVHVTLDQVSENRGVGTGALTCDQLLWIQRVLARPPSETEIVLDGRLRLDLSSNKAFESFFSWQDIDRTKMECACPRGGDCLYVDYALYYLLVALAPSLRSLKVGAIFQPYYGSPWQFPGFGDVEDGYCVRSNNADENDGVIKLSSKKVHQYEEVAECWRLCKEYNGGVGVTGCECGWGAQHSRGCYVHTSKLITHGNGWAYHYCSLVNGSTTVIGEGVSFDQLFEALSHRSPFMSVLLLQDGWNLAESSSEGPNKVTSQRRMPTHFPRSLKILRLSEYGFTGTLTDASISSLQNLEVLDLANNRLNGTILQRVVLKLTNLKCLNLGTNRMDGELPQGIGSLKSLTELVVHENHLHGSLPDSMQSLSKLEILSLATNALTGPIRVGSWPRLRTYLVQNNGLTGQIPENISSLQALESLDIENNEISGKIPPSIGTLSSLKLLDVQNNDLTGQIPENISSLQALESLDMSHNKISGTIPPSIGNLISLTLLSLGVNMLEGKIPSEIGRLKNLEALHLDSNDLSDNIPESMGDLSSLTFLAMHHNNLNGSVPDTLRKLTNLNALYLHANNLAGDLPDFTALANLRRLTFDENFRPFPDEIGSLCLNDRGTWAEFTPCV